MAMRQIIDNLESLRHTEFNAARAHSFASRQHDPERAAETLVAVLERLVGFSAFVVAGYRGRAIGTGSIIFSTWDEAVLETFLSERLFQCDPVVDALKAGERVVSRETIIALGGTTPAYKAAIDFRRENKFDVPDALIIREGAAVIGTVAVARREPFTDFEWRAILALAPEIHRAFRAPIEKKVGLVAPLTAREQECLAWTSEGKTSWEIATILGVRERTVVAHLGAAMEKLHASNRLHAVVRAIRCGLLA